MLGRRNIRIKVMQCLFAWRMDSSRQLDLFNQQLEAAIGKFKNLYAVNLAYLVAICRYAETDLEVRSAKFLKTEEDYSARSVLSQNAIVLSIQQHDELQKFLRAENTDIFIDRLVVKRVFQQLSLTAEYRTYISKSERQFEDDRAIFLFILEQFMCCTPELQQHLEEHFQNHPDDNDYMLNTLHKKIGAMKHPDVGILLPVAAELAEEMEFGKQLLEKTYRSNELLESTIKPALTNWDMERVSALDLVLLKMAVCELLCFPQIPVKVTINEYIDLAKYYSTPRSKDFVNGVLDNLKAVLMESGSIKKSGRGLVDK